VRQVAHILVSQEVEQVLDPQSVEPLQLAVHVALPRERAQHAHQEGRYALLGLGGAEQIVPHAVHVQTVEELGVEGRARLHQSWHA
jgi:hypothetical protein